MYFAYHINIRRLGGSPGHRIFVSQMSGDHRMRSGNHLSASRRELLAYAVQMSAECVFRDSKLRLALLGKQIPWKC